MWISGLDEAQVWIKIAGRNINNLRHEDETTLMAESEEELKSLLMRVKGVWKACLKLNMIKSKILASGPITLWQTEGEKVEAETDFLSLGSKTAMASDCSHEIK